MRRSTSEGRGTGRPNSGGSECCVRGRDSAGKVCAANNRKPDRLVMDVNDFESMACLRGFYGNLSRIMEPRKPGVTASLGTIDGAAAADL